MLATWKAEQLAGFASSKGVDAGSAGAGSTVQAPALEQRPERATDPPSTAPVDIGSSSEGRPRFDGAGSACTGTVQFEPTTTSAIINLIGPLSPGSGFSMGIIGSSGSGKTTFLKTFVLDNPTTALSAKLLVSPNIKLPIYRALCDRPDIACTDKFKESQLSLMFELGTLSRTNFPNNPAGVQIFTIILDDVIDQKASSVLVKSLTTYRNAGVTTIISVQSPIFLAKSARGSLNWIIFMQLNTDELIRTVLEDSGLSQFFSGTPTQKIAKYRSMTAHHGFFILDSKGTLYHSADTLRKATTSDGVEPVGPTGGQTAAVLKGQALDPEEE